MKYTDEEQVVRELAWRVSEFASSENNAQMIKRWHDVNSLRKPDRMPVYCYPSGDGVWGEIFSDDPVISGDPWLREVETYMKKLLYKRHIADDTPINPYFPVQAVMDVHPSNIWGIDIKTHHTNVKGGSWSYQSTLMDLSDFDKLRIPVYTFNSKKTEELVEKADRLLFDILPPKVLCQNILSATLCHYAANLRGLEKILMDTILEPDLLHRLMAYLRDCVLSSLDQLETIGRITPNTDGDLSTGPYSEDIGPDPVNGKYTFKNCWIYANSQEFDPVSPTAWEEFLLDYQKPIFERFGLVSYGCCENLTQKINGVMSIPNLRIFVCSAWTNLNLLLEKTDQKYVIQWRQMASDVIFAENMDKIKQHLAEGVKKLSGVSTQIMLREVETLNGNTDRLKEWTTLAKEAAAKI